MNISLVMGYFGFICTVIGQFLLIKKKAKTFLVWNIANVIQLFLAIKRFDMPLILTYCFYIVINFVTYFEWKKQNLKSSSVNA